MSSNLKLYLIGVVTFLVFMAMFAYVYHVKAAQPEATNISGTWIVVTILSNMIIGVNPVTNGDSCKVVMRELVKEAPNARAACVLVPTETLAEQIKSKPQ